MTRAFIFAILLSARAATPDVGLLTDVNSPVQRNVLRHAQMVIDINAPLTEIESVVAIDRPQEFQAHERTIRARISTDLAQHFGERAAVDTVFLIPIIHDGDLEIQAVGIIGAAPDGSYAPRWYLSYYFEPNGEVRLVRGGFVQ